MEAFKLLLQLEWGVGCVRHVRLIPCELLEPGLQGSYKADCQHLKCAAKGLITLGPHKHSGDNLPFESTNDVRRERPNFAIPASCMWKEDEKCNFHIVLRYIAIEGAMIN